jgi:hypothetical protein
LHRFSASFPYKLVTSLLLNEKAELLPVAKKKTSNPHYSIFKEGSGAWFDANIWVLAHATGMEKQENIFLLMT